VDTKSRFLKTASYGDTLLIRTHISEWRDKSFVQNYRIVRTRADTTEGEDLIMECEEVRIFASRREDGKNGIRAVPIPLEIRALCE
jgi:4-hydroxybenzoyl-CoA thioesterase